MDLLGVAPDFLAVGHVTHDLIDGRIRLGGAALYSVLTAHRMGKKAGILTSHGEDFRGRELLKNIPAVVVPAKKTSTFQTAYVSGARSQQVQEIAGSLETRSLPDSWRHAGIAYLCPVLHEVPVEMGEILGDGLLGVAPQGWMRRWNGSGKILPRRWRDFDPLLRRAAMVIVSEEDMRGNEDLVERFRERTAIVIVTRAERGARIYTPERSLAFGVYPAREQDPTGAGDCFGAAFLIRYAETASVLEAGRFASCVASFVVERQGTDGIPNRDEVLERLASHSIPIREEEGKGSSS